MQRITLLLLTALLSACSHTPAPVPQQQAAVPVMKTVVSRLEAGAPDCRLRRTLDGRAVCTTALPAAAATANLGPLPEAPADIALAAGRYVVIGSFEELDNAVDWAGLNADFGAGIQRAPSFEPTMYRVLIGPLERTDGELMQAILDSVGVAESWQLSVCHGGVTPAAAPCQPLLADTKLAQGGLPLPF